MSSSGSGPLECYGSVTIFVKRAENLRNIETFGNLDPYIVIQLGDKKEAPVYKSEIFHNEGVNPKIDTQFTLPYAAEKTLTLVVFDKTTFAKDREVGRATLQMREFSSGDLFDRAVELTYKGSAKAGTLHCSLKLSPEEIEMMSITKFSESSIKAADERPHHHKSSSHSPAAAAAGGEKFKSLHITLHSASLPNDVFTLGRRRNLYTTISIGKLIVKSESIKCAASAKKTEDVKAPFGATFIVPYKSEHTLKISIFEVGRIQKDRLISAAKINLEPSSSETEELSLQLIDAKKGNCGTIKVSVEFSEEKVNEPKVMQCLQTEAQLVSSSSSSSS